MELFSVVELLIPRLGCSASHRSLIAVLEGVVLHPHHHRHYGGMDVDQTGGQSLGYTRGEGG
jgi:hypothetical protein